MSELNVLFAKSLSELYAVQKDMENVIHPAKCTWDSNSGLLRKVAKKLSSFRNKYVYNWIFVLFAGFSAGTDYNGNHYNDIIDNHNNNNN